MPERLVRLMSRSYKKFPRIKCENSCKFGKRQANKTIRNLPIDFEIPKGRWFKKLYESYDICDYSFTQFQEWEIKDWYRHQAELINGVKPWRSKSDETLEEALGDWKKYYKSK